MNTNTAPAEATETVLFDLSEAEDKALDKIASQWSMTRNDALREIVRRASANLRQSDTVGQVKQ